MADDDIIPDFWGHVIETYQYGNDVDMFDLHSEDPASAAKHRELVGKSRESAVQLIDYVVKHKDKLLEKLKGDG